MSTFFQDEPETFFERFRAPITVGAIVLVVGGTFAVWKLVGPKEEPVKKALRSSIVTVQLPPPPPPPPPPKPEPEPQEETPKEDTPMMEQTPVINEPEPEPVATPDPPAEAMGTSIEGNGPADGFGLAKGGENGLIGGNGSGKGRNGNNASKFGWYAGQVQSTIGEALRRHAKTRGASFNVNVAIWADANGTITRAQLAGSTGDTAVDKAIRNDVLTGLRLPKAPPADMPMPIQMRLTGRRP